MKRFRICLGGGAHKSLKYANEAAGTVETYHLAKFGDFSGRVFFQNAACLLNAVAVQECFEVIAA